MINLSNVYVSDKQLAERWSVSRQTIWRWIESDPTFPKPVKLSPRCTRWRLPEVEEWEKARGADLY
ncbi:helix-turn-helix transcriptional regulator [Pseudovibrio flavus]|uniref:helix-turn-helix transcriptional regulator n=1 Tax=Pseudovibrio flavus TaxID=2529854 RepID=UPI003528E749